MKHILLGGLDVSRIGLGTMAMSGYYLDPNSSDADGPACTRIPVGPLMKSTHNARETRGT
jgi:hypothetical protein